MLHFDVVSALPSCLSAQDLQRLAKLLPRGVKMPALSSVSIDFVSESRMREINRVQRGKDHPTDVLSFATADELRKTTPVKTPVELGDLFLCPAYASKEATRRGIDEREEYLRLLIHGVMHLQGYDHASEEEEAEMFGLQEKLLNQFLT